MHIDILGLTTFDKSDWVINSVVTLLMIIFLAGRH